MGGKTDSAGDAGVLAAQSGGGPGRSDKRDEGGSLRVLGEREYSTLGQV